MHLLNGLQSAIKVLVCGIALTITFYSVMELMVFLSDPKYSKAHTSHPYESWLSILWSLIIDQCLLSVFMLQHSVLALPQIKAWLSSRKLQTLQRTLYVISTSVALLTVVKYWKSTTSVSLWHVNVDIQLYWWSFITLHVLAWLIIYVGTICMDINELLGLKQVYYGIQHLPDPTQYKSHRLMRLYGHMRHPSFIGFLVIFWMVPVMSLDRLLLAVVWTLYMYLAWNTDEQDYSYQESQFSRKFRGVYH